MGTQDGREEKPLAARAGWLIGRPIPRRLRESWPLARRVGSVLLAAWFAWQTWERITFFLERDFPLGIDATIYHRGVVAWLQGTSPWDAAVVVGGWAYHYVGTPVTTVLMAPAALLSEELFTMAWLGLTWLAAIWTLRRLRFPLWWLLFPPIAEALFSGNPQLVVLALLVVNGPLASALATALKVYAFVPLFGEGRWRQIGVAVAFNAATFLIAPGLWLDYFRLLGFLSSRLEYESTRGDSAFYFPMLLAFTAAALALLALRHRRAAGWLAVPAVWPASQFHYSTMALPVMSPLLAVLLAIPDTSPMLTWEPSVIRDLIPIVIPVAIILESARRLLQPSIMRRLMPPTSPVRATERPNPSSSV